MKDLKKVVEHEKYELMLLKAVYQILKKQDESCYVLNLLAETAVYGGAESDGYCMMGEIRDHLADLGYDADAVEVVEE
jgi:hypothetical protein